MARESTQHKLDRVRAPRVHITYDVEVGGAIQLKELPFVVGVLGDFTGQPAEPLPRLKERKFVTIDRDNFNQVLAGMKPRIAYRVDNKLTDDGTKMGVELNFRSLEDFEPEQVVRQIEPLRKLLEARQKLSDLVHKIDGNEKLEQMLQDIAGSSDTLKKVGEAAGVEAKPDKEESNG
ncbi:MAG: type VI secretion system contractile sheath small subunit [Acidobacteria bacterium]|nr:type VI secretion system contractile sheath small subunit [Acidobacteriota bacterium]